MQQGSDSYRLVVRRGPQPNQVYELNKDILTIGRDITNDITINDPEVSRHHMRLTRGAGGFTLEDLGSTNGTFVNGQRLTAPRPLSNGDLIGLGETVTLGYELARAVPGMGAAPAAPAGNAGQPYSPYQPPQQPNPAAPPAQASPYQPPAQAAPPAQASPYSPPAQAAPQPPSSPSYIQQSQSPAPAPYSPPGAQGASYSPQQAGGVYAPPPPPGGGYDYDPYAAREEEPRSNVRWLLIGCAAILLICCCGTIAAGLLVDTLCLYDSIPLIGDLLNAVGFTPTC
jgi:predicted component of type VI protein secretion system